MTPAMQLPPRERTAGDLRYGDLKSGMTFRDPTSGSTWLVIRTDSTGALGPIARVDVTYLVTTQAGESSTRRVEGWVDGTAWRRIERMDAGLEP